ncbi:MAG TPA: FecR domain-containing protein, partial [Spirochaetota bacterium]|nr:FecR domain-containing protein [Spirochaetota bacterium]
MKLAKFLFTLLLLTGLLFPYVGKIQVYKGDVKILKQGQAASRAHRFQKVDAGDVIKTGPSGYVEVLLLNKTLLRVAPNSIFTLKGEGRSREVKLTKGKLWSAINKLSADQKFNFSTPTAVAGIRGTVVRIEADAEGNERIACEEGKISVSTADGKKSVLDQHREILSRSGSFKDKQEYDPSREERWERFTTRIYLRELQRLYDRLNDLEEEADTISLDEVKAKIKSTVPAAAAELKGDLSYFNFISREINSLVFKIRDIMRDVKRIYTSRDLDPDKEEFKDIVAGIKRKYEHSLKPLYRDLKTLAQKIDSRRAEYKGALNKANQLVSQKDKSGINNKAQKLKGLLKEVETAEQKLRFIKQKSRRLGADNADALQSDVEKLQSGLDQAQQKGEYLYADIKLYLKNNPDQRQQYKALYKEVRKALVKLVRLKQDLAQDSETLNEKLNDAASSANHNRQVSADLQIKNEGKAVQLIEQIEQDMEKAFNTAYEAQVREHLQAQIGSRIRQLKRLLATVQDKKLQARAEQVINYFESAAAYARQTGRSGGATTPADTRLLQQLSTIKKELQGSFNKLHQLTSEIQELKDMEIGEQAELDDQLIELQSRMQTLRRETAAVDKYRRRFTALKDKINQSSDQAVTELSLAVSTILDKLENVSYEDNATASVLQRDADQNIDQAVMKSLNNLKTKLHAMKKLKHQLTAASFRFKTKMTHLQNRIEAKIDFADPDGIPQKIDNINTVVKPAYDNVKYEVDLYRNKLANMVNTLETEPNLFSGVVDTATFDQTLAENTIGFNTALDVANTINSADNSIIDTPEADNAVADMGGSMKEV